MKVFLFSMDLDKVFLYALFNILLLQWDFGLANPITKEFCNFDTVNITCPLNHAIIINNAQFGRMRTTSRCVTTPIQEWDGCRADVLSALDISCSGQLSCKFPLPDPQLNQNARKILGHNKCPADVTSYLLVEYTCLRVVPAANAACRNNKPIQLPYKDGYLSSAVTAGRSLGGKHCPWKIAMPSGQSVNLTAFNFYRHNINSVSEPCNSYGEITEGRGDKRKSTNIYVCNRDPRLKWVYTSAHSTVEISFNSNIGAAQVTLIHFQVSGCPDIPSIPPTQIVKRSGDQAEITCFRDGAEEKFYLTCKGTEWLGYSNCSADSTSDTSDSEGLFDTSQSFPYGLVIVVAIGVALGIFLGGIMLLCVSVYMKKKYHHDGAYIRPDYEIEYSMRNTDNSHYPTTLLRHHEGPLSPNLTENNPGNSDTLLQYIRCAKHGITASPGGTNTEQFNNSNNEQFTATQPNIIQPFRTERTNQFNFIKNSHEYEHPKQ